MHGKLVRSGRLGSRCPQSADVRTLTLPTGAEARVRNEDAACAVVLVTGGTAKRVPGTWSATSEWLAQRLAPRFPGLAFFEVRYRL